PADGIVITPSHNPPEDGGIKYNPPDGGPADTGVTGWIEKRANELLANTDSIRRSATQSGREYDYIGPYVEDLKSIVDLDAIRSAGLRLGADPLGGSNAAYWKPIAERYGLDIMVVNDRIDP